MNRYLPLILIVGLLIAFRAVGILFPESLPNFQPLAALFFCGAMMAPGWRGLALPAAIWAITYPFGIGPVYSLPIFVTTLIALVAMFLMGRSAAKHGVPTLLAGSIAAAVVFHLITSGAAWIGEPMYPKTAGGLWQSVWSGPLGYGPSWVFLRNLAAANLIFTAVFVLARLRLPRVTAPAIHPAVAH